jgi:hypothetical protein
MGLIRSVDAMEILPPLEQNPFGINRMAFVAWLWPDLADFYCHDIPHPMPIRFDAWRSIA